MKKLLLFALTSALVAAPLFAEPPKAEIKSDDTILTLLLREVGQKVELHLRSGEHLSGKLESATVTSAHLSGLSGQEFFDALVSVSDISAVVVRTH